MIPATASLVMKPDASSPCTLECVALLGRRDAPTDAVETYCEYLAEALSVHHIRLRCVRFPWNDHGWAAAFAGLQREFNRSRPALVLLQYTALAWSRHGFSLGFLRLLRFLRGAKIRFGVVFHDAAPYEGARLVDRLRRRSQQLVMRSAVRHAELSFLTLPRERIGWLPVVPGRCISIPVGANLPSPETSWTPKDSALPPAVAVFSITGGAADEVQIIADAVRYASLQTGELRLVVFGRGVEEFERLFREKLAGTAVQLSIIGVVDAREIVRLLTDASVFLFVRGHISARRGSAIAGIACGLPVVARQGWETASPITEAGVVLLPPDADGEAFGAALVRVLSDKEYAAELGHRSRQAYLRYFSWTAIAAQYAKALRAGGMDAASK